MKKNKYITADLKPDKLFINELKEYLRKRPYSHPNEINECFVSFLKRKNFSPNIKDSDTLQIELDFYCDKVYSEHIDAQSHKEYHITSIDKAKHAKGRTVKEREERRKQDVRKNLIPTLGGDDRRHFEKKYGKA